MKRTVGYIWLLSEFNFLLYLLLFSNIFAINISNNIADEKLEIIPLVLL